MRVATVLTLGLWWSSRRTGARERAVRARSWCAGAWAARAAAKTSTGARSGVVVVLLHLLQTTFGNGVAWLQVSKGALAHQTGFSALPLQRPCSARYGCYEARSLTQGRLLFRMLLKSTAEEPSRAVTATHG